MRDRIDRLIAQGQLDPLLDALDGARVQDVRYAAARLTNSAKSSTALLTHARTLAKREDSASRHLACQLTPSCYANHGEKATKLLQTLAADEDWTVRDAAAETCGRLLRSSFKEVMEELRAWREHKTVGVRRAVVIAAGRAARPDRPERSEPLLKLVEPLLADSDPAIRRSLGPSVVGASLMRCYPADTFEYLVKWSTSNDVPVLWNVAMAFSAPPAAKIARKALIVLRKLSLDERRTVWRAVASAMWKLGRRNPEIVRPELMRWLEDDRRLDVARAALQHL